MDTNDWKALLLEREQQFAEALARCRDIEHIPAQALNKIESIFRGLLAAQEQVFGDTEQDQSDIGQNSATPP